MRLRYIVALVGIVLLIPFGGHAASPSPSPSGAPAQAGIGLKIAPVKYQETLQIGQSKDGVIDVINLSMVPVTVEPGVENVRMVGENGELQFYPGTNPFEFENLIQLDKTPFTLVVGEARHVKFRVTARTGIFPGGHYGSVFFKVLATADSAGTAVAQSGRVGTLLLFTVAGDVDQKGSLENLTLNRNGFNDQKKFEALYANTGSTSTKPLGVAYEPTGELRLKDSAGITIRRQPVKGALVFPGAKRRLTSTIRKPFWLGRYTAVMSLSPGTGRPAETKSVSFWAISPLAALLLLLLLLLIAAGLGGWRRRRRSVLPTEIQTVSLMEDAEDAAPPAAKGNIKVSGRPKR